MTADEQQILENLRVAPPASMGLRKIWMTSVLVISGMALIHSPSVMLVGSLMTWQEEFLEMSGKIVFEMSDDEQIPAMTEAYLGWCLEKSEMGFRSFFDQLRSEESGTNEVVYKWSMTIIDVFFAEKVMLKISLTDSTVASALIRQGILPCSLISSMVGITTKALKSIAWHT
ncbi:hypothetical protein BDR03DRAFT_1016312 [Suillus americanus]|nr:hypothetical protein BDR03DRAFT_1016312 [Suillus americanus]